MSTFNLKKKITITLITFIVGSLFVVKAQPDEMRPNPKTMEKISMMKKMKLLEVLDLKEDETDKFITKYNAMEKSVQEKHQQLEKVMRNIGKSIKDDDFKNIDKLTDDYLKKKKEMDEAIDNEIIAVKQLLPKEKFAKYLLFERRFQEELRKAVMKRMEKRNDKRDKKRHPFDFDD
jgi:hypothetical protein